MQNIGMVRKHASLLPVNTGVILSTAHNPAALGNGMPATCLEGCACLQGAGVPVKCE